MASKSQPCSRSVAGVVLGVTSSIVAGQHCMGDSIGSLQVGVYCYTSVAGHGKPLRPALPYTLAIYQCIECNLCSGFVQEKHVETAKQLLGNGRLLNDFVSRLLDDIANLKAMLRAISIGALRCHGGRSWLIRLDACKARTASAQQQWHGGPC